MKKKMLMLDDDEALLASFFRSFELEEDWEFQSARSPQEAIQKLESASPDILVLDCNLGQGEEDGLEFLKDLRKSERYKNLPVLLVSGFRIQPEQIAQGLNLGADNYVIKPITPQALIGRADALLRYIQRMK